jgi:ATP-dependent DNA helicase RecG
MSTTKRPAAVMDGSTRVQFLAGVGPQRALAFERLGIVTLEHLVRHYPRTWLDASRFVKVKDLEPGQLLTVVGEVRHASVQRTRGGRSDFAVTVSDGSGTLPCYFFGQSWLARTLTPGTRVVVSGEIGGPERQMLNPLFEVVEGDLESLLHAGRLVPVHALTRGLSARGVRQAIRHALDALADRVADPVPAEVARERALGPLADALRDIHFPSSAAALETARHRLAFEELFLLQMVMALRRRSLAEEGRALALDGPGALAARVRASLPFTLTGSQEEALRDIAADLARSRPMHRLLVGDVGSGKTVVALLAACAAIERGQQARSWHPPRSWLASTAGAWRGSPNPPACRSRCSPGRPRRPNAARSRPGSRRLSRCSSSGTHALLERRLQFPALALAIVDEQHRFGVRQRAALAGKGLLPHVLVLSATPIPRTLQLAWFGDLELSIMRQRPAGRGRLVTRVTGEEKFLTSSSSWPAS